MSTVAPGNGEHPPPANCETLNASASGTPGTTAPVEIREPDVTEELTKLAQLHSQGILTDEEFSAKKAQLLGI